MDGILFLFLSDTDFSFSFLLWGEKILGIFKSLQVQFFFYKNHQKLEKNIQFLKKNSRIFYIHGSRMYYILGYLNFFPFHFSSIVKFG
jgi:hypothetical protein